MAPHTWSHLGNTVSDATHHMYYRGQRIKEAYYRGECIWRENRPDNVCFWDWDGTLLASYGREEFLALSEMPSLHREWTPTMIDQYDRSKGLRYVDEMAPNIPNRFENPDEILLTPDGYNWTFEEAQDFVQKFGYCDIGALYRSDCSLFWVLIPEVTYNYYIIPDLSTLHTDPLPSRLHVGRIYGADASLSRIDWGDGVIDTYGPKSDSAIAASDPNHTYYYFNDAPVHQYAEAGRYLVKVYGECSVGQYRNWITVYHNDPSTVYRTFSASVKPITLDGYDSSIDIHHGTDDIYRTTRYGGDMRGTYYMNQHSYAAFISTNCKVLAIAFRSTWVSCIGFMNGVTLPMTGELTNIPLVHITFPPSVTKTYNNQLYANSDRDYGMSIYATAVENVNSFKMGSIIVKGQKEYEPDYDEDDLYETYTISADDMPADTVPNRIKSVSLPPNFLAFDLPNASYIRRLILPSMMSTFGYLRDVTSALKLIVSGIWNISHWGDNGGGGVVFSVTLKDGTTANTALKVYVPPDVIFTHVGRDSPIYWGNGLGVYDEYLRYSNGHINAWMAPYLKELPRTVDYKTVFEDTLPDYVKPIPVWDFENNREMT